MKRFIALHPEVEFEVTYKPYYVCPVLHRKSHSALVTITAIDGRTSSQSLVG